ncbi:MAG: hypothetical protein U5N26_06300 [Candidatus Marinimicrobia bacterium]|nr:hypothetical protein [Candidatus Neomarinimicrobiota bacterium]
MKTVEVSRCLVVEKERCRDVEEKKDVGVSSCLVVEEYEGNNINKIE